ncbi:glutamate-5-semialdehyde dehydrogenase [Elioraea rosea]|uniref:glutamate-5-semialdehyde dehydrogenase n=1 Tax=Elioraea rosea TaxID=2492390 RepID=UPI00118339E9|nr:glutamate-5-semialdehyde dehydrogenase [Elioraea rosea]
MDAITPGGDAAAIFAAQARAARAAAHTLARLAPERKASGLRAAGAAIRRHADAILSANADDVAATTGRPASFLDRLRLDPPRVAAMARGVDEVAALPDPVGTVLAEWTRPNGLLIRRVATPLGVVGMIFESRPNVTADAGAICVKSGNAVILRGGSESLESTRAIHAAMREGFIEAGLPEASVQVAPTADRAFVAAMLAGNGMIDVMVPRGGRSLVERVQAEARVPVLAHAEGRCHTFVHAAADLAKARAIVVNAKLRRTGVCGATETLLIDRAVAASHLPPIVADLAAKGCTFRADAAARAVCPELPAATEADFDTEWLDAVLSVAVVDGVDGAVAHILRHGSEHTDAIITEDDAAAAAFLAGIDSAIGVVNASTQFADGGEFGFGAEIGIATGRIHARGPVGPAQLTTFRYHVIGTGQVRP